ncbi:hypothetical protein Daus18300_003281 [Diaporthe australafricana]|uniref:Amidase domain-containing protein n=1 Tax=Diaporthe australafricana TaxID=127596 RepID=A0ABR3XHG7_9PEZI
MTACALGSVDVDALDLEGILLGLDNGDFTSQDLVDTYMSRITQINTQVRAVGCLNPDARAIAIERDQQRREGLHLGALHGVPLLVKDTIVTADGMDTTGGSYALVGAKYSHEATVVTKIRDAGGIILGKTNLSQWGMSRSQKCPSGWTSLFGQAVGGFHESQDPQGSSSGSAIAACQNLAAATIGGEISRLSQFSLRVLIFLGKDEQDQATKDIITLHHDSRLQTGMPSDWSCQYGNCVYTTADSDPEVGAAFKAAIDKIHTLGATIVDDIDFDHWKPGSGQREDLFGDILLREALEKFFSTMSLNPNDIKNISDLIEFIKSTPEEQYGKFGAEWFESARDAPWTSTSDAFLEVKGKMENLGKDVERPLDGFAITFAGRKFSEETILSCAYSFEQATKVANVNREKLKIKPRNELKGGNGKN